LIGTEATSLDPCGSHRPEIRPVPANRDDLLRELQSDGLGFSESMHRASIPLHAHENATITILLGGTFEESYDGSRREQSFLASSILLRPPGEPHADRFGRNGALNFVVELAPSRMEKLLGHTDVFAEITSRRDVTIQQIARKMHHELALSDSAAALALEGFTFELLAHVSRNKERSKVLGQVSWLNRARDVLHDRFRSGQLRIAELAAEVGVHPVHLARTFRAQFGLTPGEYLRRVRLTWAQQALAETGGSIGEIAAEAGFADQSHFTREFRRAFGETPGQFRRSLGVRLHKKTGSPSFRPPCSTQPEYDDLRE
jgi:AraC family transcriptional regulator